MASPVKFARAMRARGFRYHRPRRGLMRFGGRFNGGFGILQSYPTAAIALCTLDETGLADLALQQAQLSAGSPIPVAIG